MRSAGKKKEGAAAAPWANRSANIGKMMMRKERGEEEEVNPAPGRS